MNKLYELVLLKNHYFGMRHGQSLANCEGLIVSQPENGILNYGLSNEGKKQVRDSIIRSIDEKMLGPNVQIITSDFKRARESAEIAHALLKSNQSLIQEAKLRERDFGEYELSSDSNYQKTWQNDAVDSSHTLAGVESADSVMDRVSSLILTLEKNHTGKHFLLVAHGDTLQILQTAFKKYPASKQRELQHLETAEIRALRLI